MIFSIILLSISLSIDSLGIGTTYGLRSIKIPILAKLIISIQSIIITSVSLLCGKWLSGFFTKEIAENIGILILIFMGIWILFQGIRENGKDEVRPEKNTMCSFIIKSMGITIQIIRTPQYCDMDNSSTIDPIEAIYLGLALSLDSFGVGLGSGASGMISPLIPLLIAFCQILFLTLGSSLGKRLAVFSNINSKIWVITSGFLLILIGVLRMI